MAFATGINAGAATAAGTINIATGGAVTLGAASKTGTLIHNGSAAGSLALGANSITVATDYNNANFGTGNFFNRRANVSTSGAATPRIIAAGDANQGVSGATVSGGTTTSPTLTLGNVRVGATTVTYNIDNTGSSGPSLRGAIQTSVNGGNISDVRLSGTGVTAGNWGPVATGTGLSRDVTFTVASAGAYAALTGQAVRILNNFENTQSQLLTINSAAGAAAYNVAAAGVVAPVVLPKQRVGGSAELALTITNTAPAGSFTEKLDASFGTLTGAALNNAGAANLVAVGAPNTTSMALRVDTSTAGAKAGTAQINFVSNGTGTSGLAPLAIGNQTVNVSGEVYRLATAGVAPSPVVLANQRVGGTATQALTITNTAAADGFSEKLNASFGVATGNATTNSGSFTLLAAGANNNTALRVGVDTSSAGAKTGTTPIALASDGTGTSGFGALGIATQNVTVSGNVYNLAAATLGSISFGNVVVGSSQTRYVTVSNSAPAGLFSEGLDAVLGSFSGTSAGLLSSTGGSITNLAAGSSANTTLGVTLNTSASGAVTASVQVLLGSNGAGTSNLGVFALPSQNVAIAGQIDALVYNLAAPSAATPNPVNFGNVRVGASVASQSLTISNTALSGPQEGLNASISTATSGLNTTGSLPIAKLAPGATDSTSLKIGMDTATAGSRNGTATIALASDGTLNTANGLAPTPLTSQTINVTGGVYRLADGSVTPTSVVLNAREGGVASAPITVNNIAANDGFSEGLRAAAGGASNGTVGVAGTSGLIAAGGNSGGISVSINTATAGAKSGVATVNYQSDGAGTSNLGLIGAGSDTINVSGSVYRAAIANALASTINLGTVRTGTVVDTALSISNAAVGVAGYTETLGASFGATSAGINGLGSISGLAYDAGASSAMAVRYNAGAPGAFSGTAAVNYVSQEINSSGLGNLALASQSVTVNATVNALAQLGLTNNGAYTLTSGGAYAATLDFGAISSAASLANLLSAQNLASILAPADSLVGSFNTGGLGGTPFSLLAGSSFDLAAGTGTTFQLGFNPIVAGLYTGTLVLNLASHNLSQSDLALTPFTLTLRGQLTGGTGGGVPDSGSTAVLLSLGFLGLVATRRWQRRA